MLFKVWVKQKYKGRKGGLEGLCGNSGVKSNVERVISMISEEYLAGVSPSTWGCLISICWFSKTWKISL